MKQDKTIMLKICGFEVFASCFKELLEEIDVKLQSQRTILAGINRDEDAETAKKEMINKMNAELRKLKKRWMKKIVKKYGDFEKVKASIECLEAAREKWAKVAAEHPNL